MLKIIYIIYRKVLLLINLLCNEMMIRWKIGKNSKKIPLNILQPTNNCAIPIPSYISLSKLLNYPINTPITLSNKPIHSHINIPIINIPQPIKNVPKIPLHFIIHINSTNKINPTKYPHTLPIIEKTEIVQNAIG